MDLDARKRLVLRAVVTDYVRTAEPVGSERLADTHDFAAKAATIRNEMSALSSLGYLCQPHTSAGRIPSDKGYRFYVDQLMLDDMSAQPRVPTSGFRDELDEVLSQTCRILAGLTHCAAIATRPHRESVTLQQIHITPVTATRALVVAILSSGEVEPRIIDLGEALPASTLTRLNNLFNEQLSGRTLNRVRGAELVLPPDMRSLAGAATKVAATLADVVKDDDGGSVLEGATHVLRAPEFQVEARREELLKALEDRRDLLESLRALTDQVGVTIGSENPRPSMQAFSFVSTRYYVGTNMVGMIGVFGPTRMAYGHTVPAVRKISRVLGDVLSRLSVE